MKGSRHYALFSTLFPLYMWANTTHWYRCMYGHSWKEADPTHCFLRCFPNICEQTPLTTHHVCTIITWTYEYIIYCSLCLLHHLHNTHRPRRLLPSFTSAGIYTVSQCSNTFTDLVLSNVNMYSTIGILYDLQYLAHCSRGAYPTKCNHSSFLPNIFFLEKIPKSNFDCL